MNDFAHNPVSDLQLTSQHIAADIAKELRAHPEHWGRGSYAQGTDGRSCPVHDPAASRWCLAGLIWRRLPTRIAYVQIILYVEPFDLRTREGSAIEWNDDDDRTVEEVIALCDRVAAIPDLAA